MAFSVDALVCRYHTHQSDWNAKFLEELPCQRVPGNHDDTFSNAWLVGGYLWVYMESHTLLVCKHTDACTTCNIMYMYMYMIYMYMYIVNVLTQACTLTLTLTYTYTHTWYTFLIVAATL